MNSLAWPDRFFSFFFVVADKSGLATREYIMLGVASYLFSGKKATNINALTRNCHIC